LVLHQIGAAALVDRRGRSRYVTEEACALVGYGREELLALDGAGLFPDARLPVLWRQVRAHGPRVVESHLRTRDGRLLPVEIHARPFQLEGDPLLLCLARERLTGATADRRGNGPPALGESTFRCLAENLSDNVVRYDQAGRITYANRALCRTLGQPIEQLIGRGLDQMQDMEWARAFMTRITGKSAAAHPEELKIAFRSPSGEEQIHLVRFVTEVDEQGSFLGTLAISRDITAMERSGALLHERAEAFRALAENSPDTIARFDRQGRRVYVNRAVSRGAGETDAMAGDEGALSHPSVGLPRIVQNVLRLGKMFEGEVPYFTSVGEKRWEHLRVVPEFGPDGTIVSALAIGHDITQSKVMEQHLKESRAEVRALAAMRENSREEERKRLARELHDELGQALMALRLEIKIAESPQADATQARVARTDRILSLLDKTGGVIKDVIAALRPTALDGGLGPAMEWLTTDFAERTGIPCTLETEEEIGLDEPRAVALFRILQEALTNVARHARASRVLVRFERYGIDYRLSIRDDGIGFDPSQPRKKSFGLVGMRERALAIGGLVAVSSAPGHGTDVVVLLPAKREAPI
jgi:PAS domain S-box-containing protein